MQEFSTKLKQDARKAGVPVQTLIMADLMAIGYSKSDAYNIAYIPSSAQSKMAVRNSRDGIIEKDSFEELLQQRRALYTGIKANVDDIELISDLEVAKDILTSARRQPVGTKERADLMAKYYDITKKIGTGTDGQEVVKVWLPLTCHICPFYKKGIKSDAKGQKEGR